jgi:hypothetical protein
MKNIRTMPAGFINKPIRAVFQKIPDTVALFPKTVLDAGAVTQKGGIPCFTLNEMT